MAPERSAACWRCCLLTPSSVGAVAVVWIHGDPTAAWIDARFVGARGARFGSMRDGQWSYGSWTFAESESGEDVIVLRISKDEVEVHLHGGTESRAWVIEELTAAGATVCSQHEYHVARGDHPSVADVRLALQRATTERTARFLNDQIGVWKSWLETLERMPESDRQEAIDDWKQRADAWSGFAQRLTTPWKVVIAGKPNVGKSSLMNALSGYSRAIVHHEAGTTRDVVSQELSVDGWPIRLMDTAGIREASGDIERQGVALGQMAASRADAVIGVFDASEPWSEDDARFLESLKPDVIVWNKCDLASVGSDRPPGICISALTGVGIRELESAIVQVLIPELPPAELPLRFSDGFPNPLTSTPGAN